MFLNDVFYFLLFDDTNTLIFGRKGEYLIAQLALLCCQVSCLIPQMALLGGHQQTNDAKVMLSAITTMEQNQA